MPVFTCLLIARVPAPGCSLMHNVLLAGEREQHTKSAGRLPDRKPKDDACYFVSSIFHSRFSLHSETSSNSSSSSSPAALSNASFAAAQVVRSG